VRFAVKIHPVARKNAIPGELGDALQISLTSPPWKALPMRPRFEFFAKLLKVLGGSVTIASGQTRRGKVIRVQRFQRVQVRQHTGM
jgi:uncharacterized protein YggU (UPF0235/DUF167 family)